MNKGVIEKVIIRLSHVEIPIKVTNRKNQAQLRFQRPVVDSRSLPILKKILSFVIESIDNPIKITSDYHSYQFLIKGVMIKLL